MRDEEYEPDQIAAYGADEQPAIAARMAPHLRMVSAGTGCAVFGSACALGAVVAFPRFSDGSTGQAWAVAALVGTLLMTAVAVIQLMTWRRAFASWRGKRPQDLHGEVRLSWIAHLASYPVALLALFGCIQGSGAAGWSSNSAMLLAGTLLLVLAAQVLAGVQYLRASGPPGTIPAHLRRLANRRPSS